LTTSEANQDQPKKHDRRSLYRCLHRRAGLPHDRISR
jgi:hypothetical protein